MKNFIQQEIVKYIFRNIIDYRIRYVKIRKINIFDSWKILRRDKILSEELLQTIPQ